MSLKDYVLIGIHTGEVRGLGCNQHIYQETVKILTKNGYVCWETHGIRRPYLRPEENNGFTIYKKISLENFLIRDLDELIMSLIETNHGTVSSNRIEDIRKMNWPFYKGIYFIIRGKKQKGEFTNNIVPLFPKQ